MVMITKSIVFMIISIASADYLNVNWNTENKCKGGDVCTQASFPVGDCYLVYIPTCYNCRCTIVNLPSTKYQVLVFDDTHCNNTPTYDYVVDTDNICREIGVTDWAATSNVSLTPLFNDVSLYYPENVKCVPLTGVQHEISGGVIALIVVVILLMIFGAVGAVYFYKKREWPAWTPVSEDLNA